MRQGFTQINNDIFDIGLKPNELALCVWLLSHTDNYKLSTYRITKELGIKYETIIKLIHSIQDKIQFSSALDSEKIMEKLEKIRKSQTQNNKKNNSKNGVPKMELCEKNNSKNGIETLQKRSVDNSKNGERITPKMENIEYYRILKNTKGENPPQKDMDSYFQSLDLDCLEDRPLEDLVAIENRTISFLKSVWMGSKNILRKVAL